VDPPSSVGWSFQNTQIVIASLLFLGLVVGPPVFNLAVRKKKVKL